MRLDQWLVKHQKVRSRSQAEELIKRGDVFVFNLKENVWIKVSKPSLEIDEHFNSDHLKIESVISNFVSRSGYKLKKALEHLNLSVSGLKCLDVGQSTGGFSQVLLESNADYVVGVDVGKNQLSEDLLKYENLKCFENLDIRNSSNNIEFIKQSPFDVAVIDVSFISLTQVLATVLSLLKPNGHIVALVKPQFELSKNDLDKKGIVKDKKNFLMVENKIKDFVNGFEEMEFKDFFTSKLEGKDGNIEFFIYVTKK